MTTRDQGQTGGGQAAGGTALRRYVRLESRGLWRELPEAQRREVVVGLRQATLVISDPKSDQPLTHWSLPAVTRLNPGQMPALYAPGEGAAETLELDDDDMMAALATVHGAIERARPHPGRLRGAGTLGLVAGLAAAALFWLPGAVINHTAGVLPPATRTDIGAEVLVDLTQLTGPVCTGSAGRAALNRLTRRLFPDDPAIRLEVVREGTTGALHLPGDQIILSQALLAEADGPEVAAGHALAEAARATATDPLPALLRHAGLFATLRLLTSGRLPAGAVDGYAEALLGNPPADVPVGPLLARFRTVGLSAAPYAFAVDPTGEAVLPLVEGDPFPQGAPAPLMADQDWVALQDICGG